jgi:hypothetical protein
LPDVKNWMSGLGENTQLLDIIMPGSHDAGVSLKNAVKVKGYATEWCACQYGSLYDQACAGSRFFDCRVFYQANAPSEEVNPYLQGKFQKALNNNEDMVQWKNTHSGLSERRKLKFGHFFLEKGDETGMGGTLGAYGGSLKDSINEAVAFVSENDSEFIILRFSHSGSPKHLTDAMRHWITKYRANKWSECLFVGNVNSKNIAEESYSRLKGKVVLVFDGKHNELDINLGLHAFSKYEDLSTGVPKSGLTCCGNYSRTSDIAIVAKTGLDDSRLHFKHPRNHLHFVYYQQTLMGGSILDATTSDNKTPLFKKKPEPFTGGARVNMPNFFEKLKSLADGVALPTLVNVISHDFIDPATCKQIVSLNPGFAW